MFINVHLYTSLYLIVSLSTGLSDLPSLTATPATNSTTTIKRQLFSLPVFSPSHIKSGRCVLSACLWREPPVLCDSRLLLLHTSYCHCQRGNTHTHVHTYVLTHTYTLYKLQCSQGKLQKMGLVLQTLCCDEIMQLTDDNLSQRAVCCDNGSTWHLVGIMASFPLH